MYLSNDFGSGVVNGAHDALGATPGQTFGFAAATTASGEYGYLTFGNTNNTAVNVTVTYYRFNGSAWSTIGKRFTIPATTRFTISLRDVDMGALFST